MADPAHIRAFAQMVHYVSGRVLSNLAEAHSTSRSDPAGDSVPVTEVTGFAEAEGDSVREGETASVDSENGAGVQTPPARQFTEEKSVESVCLTATMPTVATAAVASPAGEQIGRMNSVNYASKLYALQSQHLAEVSSILESEPLTPLSWPASLRIIVESTLRKSTERTAGEVSLPKAWRDVTEEARWDLRLKQKGGIDRPQPNPDKVISVLGERLLLLLDEVDMSYTFHDKEGSRRSMSFSSRQLRGPLMYLPASHSITIERGPDDRSDIVLCQTVTRQPLRPYVPPVDLSLLVTKTDPITESQ